jgi:arsenite methyltransferase
MKGQPGFFDFAAEVGLTKHIGGIQATEVLVQLCHIDRDKYVLDVGCGVGVTPCLIAKRYGCRVMGVDISPRMVERSQERAAREKLTGLVEFRVADAQDLPFETNVFDAVMTESVTAFPADKQKAVNEYVRVTKQGGTVGLNETIWLKLPPPPEIVAWVAQDVGANVQPLTPEAWSALMEHAGLTEVMARTYSIKTQDEARGIVQRYGWTGMLSVMGRMLLLYIRSRAYRNFVKQVSMGGVMPDNLQEYFGYGLFVGQK